MSKSKYLNYLSEIEENITYIIDKFTKSPNYPVHWPNNKYLFNLISKPSINAQRDFYENLNSKDKQKVDSYDGIKNISQQSYIMLHNDILNTLATKNECYLMGYLSFSIGEAVSALHDFIINLAYNNNVISKEEKEELSKVISQQIVDSCHLF